MIAFIDDHREVHGVEPICTVLPSAPSTYRTHVAQRTDPARLSARAKRDATLKIEVRRVFEENFGVYGARTVWRQLKREGIDVARCTEDLSKSPFSKHLRIFTHACSRPGRQSPRGTNRGRTACPC